MGWTDERVELLRKLWLDGHSASQIAKQLGEVTRNAVIGKVHRLGLSGRATPSQPTRPAFKAPRPPRPAVRPREIPAEPGSGLRSHVGTLAARGRAGVVRGAGKLGGGETKHREETPR